MSAKVGYDSNITLSHDGDGDSFVQGTPSVTFLKRNSSTQLQAIATASITEFINNQQPRQDDYSLKGIYAYPYAPHVVPVYEAEALFKRASEPNQYLGRLVEYNQSSATAEGYLPLTGKLGLRAKGDFNSTKYENALNHNVHGQVFLGIAYQRTPHSELSLNAGAAFGRSTPSNSAPAIRSRERYLTVRFRGQVTPKISGSMHAGFGQVGYRGGYTNTYNLPVAGADLTWGIDPRRTLVLAAYSGADYTADGQSVNTQRAFLSFTNVIINRWQLTVRGGPAHSVFSREFRQRTDDSWQIGGEFGYRPSDSFNVSLSATHTYQDSDVVFNEFQRSVFSLGAAYRF